MSFSVVAWLFGAVLGAGPVEPGELVRYGELIVTNTRAIRGVTTNARLNCTSCHLDRGRTANAAPWVGLWGMFPEYRPRAGRMISMEDRIGDCFERSLNGHAPASGSREMQAILAYMRWLSEELPSGTVPPGRGFVRVVLPPGVTPSAERGKRIYASRCAQCHGADGAGTTGPGFFYPPLWGPASFNIGAGMARVSTAAAFVKANMPYGRGNTLTDLEAFDVALFFTSQPRPDFAGKTRDWPNGDKPADARY